MDLTGSQSQWPVSKEMNLLHHVYQSQFFLCLTCNVIPTACWNNKLTLVTTHAVDF